MQLRKVLICLTIVLAIASIAGIGQLQVTPDTRVLLNPEDPRVVALNNFEDTYGAQNTVAFIISCEQPAYSCVDQLPDLVRMITIDAIRLPFAVRVDSLSTHPFITSKEDSIYVSNYLDNYCEVSCPKDLFETVDHPERIARFVNQTATVFGVYITLNFDVESTKAVETIYSAANSLIAENNQIDGVSIRFVGRVPLMQAFVDATNNELTGLMGAALAIIFGLVWLSFGNLRLSLVLISLSILTILSTLGLAGWTGLVISTATAALPTIILTLTTATAMHYFMHVIRTMSEDPHRNQKQVAYGAVSYQIVPTLMTAATTVIAMTSMTTVDSPPFKQLGIWTAVSLFYACLYLFLFVPAIVGKLPRIRVSRWQQTVQPLLNQHARVLQKRRSIAIAALGISFLFGAFIVQLKIDDDFVRYFGPNSTFRADTEFTAANLVGPTNLDVIIDSGRPGGIYENSYLLQVEGIATELRKFSDIDSVFTIIDIIDPFSTHFASTPWEQARPELIAQLLFSYELSLEEGQSVNNFVDADYQSTRISIAAKDITSEELAELEANIVELGQRIGKDVRVTVTGESLPLAFLSRNNIPEVMLSLLGILLLASLALGLYFRSFRISVLLAITTIVPMVLGFGIWSIFNPTVGLAATVILSVCMGVVIDDSIHLIYRYQDGLTRLNLDPFDAAAFAVHRVGNAITTTTLILVMGFGVLSFSTFEINRTFGICTVLILIAAIVIDLLILPSLLPSGGNHKKRPEKHQYGGNKQSAGDEI